MITEPEKAMVMGGTWRIPVLMKLLDKNFLQDLKRDGTFNEASFDREYESKWTGTVAGAFFNGEVFDRSRKLLKPEYEASGRSSNSSYYILSVDVGRKGCESVVTVFKVIPQSMGAAHKSLVNIYGFSDDHFEDQAIKIKSLFYKYNARRVVIDANGLGIGLIDFMVKSQTDPKTGDVYPDFGVYNDDELYYKKFRTADTEMDAMYLIKANAPINTEMYSYVQSQIMNGKVKFLIDEQTAKVTLMSKKVGQEMTPEKRNEYLIPFQQTTILREQMLNLVEENEGVNIILKQDTRSILKDKFSAFGYGMYYIKLDDSKRNKRKSRNISDFMFFS